MEWLQTYKIGKALLHTNKYEKVDSYFEQYYLPKYEIKNGSSKKELIDKTPYILDIVIDFNKVDVYLDSCLLQKDKVQENIKTSNFFRGIAGRFDSYYIVVPFKENQKEFEKKIGSSLKKFFEDAFEEKENKKLKIKKRIVKGYEELYEDMIKEELLSKDSETDAFKKSKFIETRRKILDNTTIIQKLNKYFEFDTVKSLVYADKKVIKEFDKKEVKDLKPLENRLDISKNGKDTIAYIQIKVIDKDEVFYLNKCQDYRNFCFQRFYREGKLINSNKSNGSCYFEKKITEVYPVEFPRDSINILKISTDTTVNYKSYFTGGRFLMCKEAFDAIKLGAWYIQRHLTTQIAGINHYIIPDFTNDFDLLFFDNEIKPKIDIAFQSRNYIRTKRNLETISCKGLNALTFIGFDADDRKIEVVNRIQTVSPDRFNQIIDQFNKLKEYFELTKFSNWFVKFSFSSIYGLFPENGTEAKVPQSIIFCKQLLENHLIDKGWILLQYQRLIHIYYYRKADKEKKFYPGTNISVFENSDYAITIATLKYLILLKMIDNLYNNVTKMNESFFIEEQPKTKCFFEAFSFENSAKRAMFYLGKLVRRTSEAQFNAKHRHKPILNRINHFGMKPSEIQTLSLEVLDKMRQYNKSQKTLNFAQQDIKYFEYYYCQAEEDWSLTDIENVFYLYTGYGMYWEVIEKQEVDAQKKVGIVQDVNDFNTEDDLDETNIITENN